MIQDFRLRVSVSKASALELVGTGSNFYSTFFKYFL